MHSKIPPLAQPATTRIEGFTTTSSCAVQADSRFFRARDRRAQPKQFPDRADPRPPMARRFLAVAVPPRASDRDHDPRDDHGRSRWRAPVRRFAHGWAQGPAREMSSSISCVRRIYHATACLPWGEMRPVGSEHTRGDLAAMTRLPPRCAKRTSGVRELTCFFSVRAPANARSPRSAVRRRTDARSKPGSTWVTGMIWVGSLKAAARRDS